MIEFFGMLSVFDWEHFSFSVQSYQTGEEMTGLKKSKPHALVCSFKKLLFPRTFGKIKNHFS